MKSNYIAKGGLFTALSIIFLYVAAIMPTNKIAFLALASAVIPVTLITCNLKSAYLVYISTCILSFIIPNKGICILYIFIFGFFGIIKFYAEKMTNKIFEYIIKFAYFNIALLICYSLYKFLLLPIDNLKFPIGILIVIAEFMFLLYDYILTGFISYFMNKFKNMK